MVSLSLLSRTKFYICKPFVNLTPAARVLQLTRLLTSISVILFTIILIIGPNITPRVYIIRLDCSHVDVSHGLFAALRSSADSNQNSLDSNGSGLTASEIEILSEYTQSRVSNAPQYILSGLSNWCFGNYNTTYTVDRFGKTRQNRKILFNRCTSRDPNYVFDYRGELSTIGLNIILAYAYEDTQAMSNSTGSYVPDGPYSESVARRRDINKTLPGLLLFSLSLHAIMLVAALGLYGNRVFDKDDHRFHPASRQLMAIGALAAFATTAVVISIVTGTYTSIRHAIGTELGDFGLSSHFGSVWFTIAWFDVVLSLISAASWGGPIWCGAPDKLALIEDDQEYIGTPVRRQKPQFTSHKTFSSDTKDSFESLLRKPETQDSLESRAPEMSNELSERKKWFTRPNFIRKKNPHQVLRDPKLVRAWENQEFCESDDIFMDELNNKGKM